ncbi:MAG: hypothetical protein LUH41_01235 [Clostridiales bacterium]|nr:hypothetical protein [Clostridiales bacterium]
MEEINRAAQERPEEDGNTLERLAFRIHAGVNAVEAIQIAIDIGPQMGEAWADGLWLVCDTLHRDSERLRAYVEGLR